MKNFKVYLFLAIFVVPYVVIALPGVPRWLGRTIATSILVSLFTVSIFWFGISPQSKIIRESGKFSQPQFAKIRPKIEQGIRVVVLAFGILICVTTTFPLASDLIRLATGNEPAKITGVVAYRTVPFMGVLLLAQSIRFSRSGGSYYLLYSLRPIRVGRSYEFVVLPRSRFIVDFRESGK